MMYTIRKFLRLLWAANGVLTTEGVLLTPAAHLKKLTVLAAAAMLAACSYPENAGWNAGQSGGRTVSVAFLKSQYGGSPCTILEDLSIRGWVVSSDRSGNYYKMLALTDDTAAIEIRLDAESLFETYPAGTIVEVSCGGLTLGSYGGAVQLGAASDSGYEVGYIPAQEVPRRIRITGALEQAPQPELLTIGAADASQAGRLVAFEGVQFVEFPESWCDEDSSDSSGYRDTDRTVIDRHGQRLAVRTSRRAEFASWTLPAGSGRIEGILSCFAGRLQLRVIAPEILYDDMSSPRF